MANLVRSTFLNAVTKRYGILKKLPNSDSLFAVDNGKARIYVRYSKKHARNSTFYGLRKVDLNALEGRCGILCFLWEPLFVPFSEFEDVFAQLSPASDGQYKVQIYEQARERNSISRMQDGST